MKYTFSELNIQATGTQALKAAALLKNELQRRTGKFPEISSDAPSPKFILKTDEKITDKDFYEIVQDEKEIKITAKTVRGLIFGYSLFLRKCLFKNGKITLIKNISGKYAPQKKLRGHQAGYRAMPNTYDAWDYDQYFRHFLDLMAFGANTCEQNGSNPADEKFNKFMKYKHYDHLREVSRLADTIDLDISVWHSNDDDEPEEDALRVREELYSSLPRLNILFPPGGDPGNLTADVFVDRVRKISNIIKKYHPDALMHPSAQAPHEYPDWGEVFAKEMSKLPEEIDAVIMGPNHAFPMHELRKRIPEKYPIRFFPDLTHNLRCEYPVNFLDDDWHFAFASTMSRESVNPRPQEFRTLHRIFTPYTFGSVSYSEGVHDDLNKMVWSAMEWDSDTELREIILDYARFFMYGADEEKITDCILALEKNWHGAPEENIGIDFVHKAFCELKADYPSLDANWRFLLLYFRACCDKVVKMRRQFELNLCRNAKEALENGDIGAAVEILEAPFSEDYTELRNELNILAERLFNLIGIQLDLEHYSALNWERGATLETIDNNVTDRAFLLEKCKHALTLAGREQKEFTKKLISVRSTKPGEVYYSVALHGLRVLGVPQDGEFYMDIQGDRPYTKETPLPMGMTKVFDHFSFKAHFGGFAPDTDYALKIAYKAENAPEIKHHKITANGKVIYEGARYGGKEDPDFDKDFLAPGFASAEYTLPKEVFINGTLELEISEPTEGFKFCELWIKPNTK